MQTRWYKRPESPQTRDDKATLLISMFPDLTRVQYHAGIIFISVKQLTQANSRLAVTLGRQTPDSVTTSRSC